MQIEIVCAGCGNPLFHRITSAPLLVCYVAPCPICEEAVSQAMCMQAKTSSDEEEEKDYPTLI